MEIALVVAVLVVGVVVAYLAQQAITGRGGSVRRAFARVAPSTVGAPHPPGVRRLSGTARPLEEPPVSEASGRPYLAQDLRIAASDGGDSGSTRAVDFLLDGTGVALVRAEHGLVTMARDFEAPRTTLDKVPWVDALLRAGGYCNGSPATCEVRVYEGVLLPGGHAGVVGHVEPADAAARAVGATVVVRAGDATAVIVHAEAADR